MSDEPEPQPKRVQRTVTLAKLNLGKLRLERRRDGKFIYARAFLDGVLVGKSTGEETLNAASKVAQNWYLEQLDRIRRGEHLRGKTFAECAEDFLKYADTSLKNEVSDGQREQYRIKWAKLKKHFPDSVKVNAVDAAFLVKLRDDRHDEKTPQRGTPTKPSTIKKDMVFVRLVLRHARERMKVIDSLPEFPTFRGTMAVVNAPTPFLTLAEFNKLVLAAREKMNQPTNNTRLRDQRRELYAFIMICVGAALRVHEAFSLRWMDCTETSLPNAEKQPAVLMMVKSKVSKGGQRLHAYGIYTAVKGFQSLKKWRPHAEPEDKLFQEHHSDGLTTLLKDADLYVSQHPKTQGQTRDARSFRATGMSMQIEYSANPDYTKIAAWARTSPQMLQDWYDQNHPERSVASIAAFRGDPKRKKP
jgi:hypothetical protein